MPNNFQIVISAVDRATANINKVNRSLSQFTRPVKNLQRSLSNLSKTAGIDEIGKSLVSVGKSASVVGSKIAAIGAPLLALVGGGTIAGIAALTNQWALFGAATARTATTIGVTTANLQLMRGAASAVGISTETLDGGLKALGDTMEDALYGRNPQAMAVLSRLGIGIHKTADGAIDVKRAWNEMSEAIKGQSPQVQGVIARTFGLESNIALLREGKQGLADLQQMVKDYGGEQSDAAIAKSKSFAKSLTKLDIATLGLKNSIGEHLVPALQPLVEKWALWISKNQELIGTKVGKFVEGLAHWLDKIDLNRLLTGVENTIKGIGRFVDAIGGWKTASILLVGVLSAGLIKNVLELSGLLLKLGGNTISTVVKGVGLLAESFGGAALTAGSFLKILGGIGAVAAAGVVGWEIGKNIINPILDGIAKMISGKPDATFGTLTADLIQKDPNADWKNPDMRPGGRYSSGKITGLPSSAAPTGARMGLGRARSKGEEGMAGAAALTSDELAHDLLSPNGGRYSASNLAQLDSAIQTATNPRMKRELLVERSNINADIQRAIAATGGGAGMGEALLKGAIEVNINGAPRGTTVTTDSPHLKPRISSSMPTNLNGP